MISALQVRQLVCPGVGIEGPVRADEDDLGIQSRLARPASKALWRVIKSLDIDLSHLRQRTGDAGLDFEEIAKA